MNEAALDRAALDALVGRTLHDRYRIDALLGSGGMGGVFRARHLGLGRDVAIKILHPGVRVGTVASARFVREAQSMSRLDHAHCVRVMDFGELEDGTRYLAMQLLSGEELRSRLGAPWAPREAIDLTLQILDGLAHAHSRGVIHRDLKPENVIITTGDRGQPVVKIVDFGIAKLLEGDGSEARLTRTGMRFGTPRYMSPEQAGGGKVDARTDLYAVGLLLYEMLTGRLPFVADDVATLMRMHILTPPPALPEFVPRSLAAIVLRLLAKSRKQRFDSAEATIAALTAARAELEPTRSGPFVRPQSVTYGSSVTGRVRAPNRAGLFAGVGLVALAAMAVAIVLALQWQAETPAATTTSAAPSVAAVAPTIDRSRLRACRGKDCKCKGHEACNVSCVDDCKLECKGEQDCTLVCGDDCEAECKGPGQCIVDVGDESEVECKGSGPCDVTCRGDCEVDCKGSGGCSLRCLGERAGDPLRCDDRSLACGECD